MTDIVERMNEWLAAQPDPRGRTFHPLHPETLIAQGIDEIERLREALLKRDSEIERLCEALQDLLDVQNGPPLPGRYAKEWRAAVDQARAVLGYNELEDFWDD